MAQQDGVYQNPNGTWSAMVGGNVVYTGANQDAQNAFIANQPGGTNTLPGATASNPSGNPNAVPGYQGINSTYDAQLNAQIYNAALLAMQQKQLDLVSVPMAQDQRFQAVEQAGRDAVNGMISSAQTGLTQQQQQQGQLQAAANAQTSEAQNALALGASLSGPADWGKQMEAIYGMNRAGLSGAVGSLSSRYNLPVNDALQAPLPGPASLASIGQKFASAGGWEGGLTPSQLAMQGALNNQPGGPNGASVTSNIDAYIQQLMKQNNQFASLPMGSFTDANGKVTTTAMPTGPTAYVPTSTQTQAATPPPPTLPGYGAPLVGYQGNPSLIKNVGSTA